MYLSTDTTNKFYEKFEINGTKSENKWWITVGSG
jgi:hypothetical protein